ncbi:VOC family protein [Streptomyces sp. NPDC048172]|uniref:VOC family protein n=1 Tax=Streptomyces sp. NPDC048172 TaxID=3365505 RepID=UPI00370F8418
MSSQSPTAIPVLTYRDPRAALAFLERAFGFTTLAAHEDGNGTVVHAEMRRGDGVVMFGQKRDEGVMAGLGPSAVYVVVDDPDALHATAEAAGAEIVMPLTDMDYGSREFAAKDPEGNFWSFGTYAPKL